MNRMMWRAGAVIAALGFALSGSPALAQEAEIALSRTRHFLHAVTSWKRTS